MEITDILMNKIVSFWKKKCDEKKKFFAPPNPKFVPTALFSLEF